MENIEILKELIGIYDYLLYIFEGFFLEIEKMKSLIIKIWISIINCFSKVRIVIYLFFFCILFINC